MRRALAGMILLSLAGFGVGLAVAGGEEEAEKPVQQKMDTNVRVSIGDSASSAKYAIWHNITTEALMEGRREFDVRSARKKDYKISLTKNQLDMILEGTRVAVPTTEGDKRVVISLKRKPKPEKKEE